MARLCGLLMGSGRAGSKGRKGEGPPSLARGCIRVFGAVLTAWPVGTFSTAFGSFLLALRTFLISFPSRTAPQISILKRLCHRHIVHLREVLVSSTKLYLVMDYVNGGELFDLLEQRGALVEDEARRYFHQLVDAINYCHSVGVSHRDLKVCSPALI